jgi:hypothetical protein
VVTLAATRIMYNIGRLMHYEGRRMGTTKTELEIWVFS